MILQTDGGSRGNPGAAAFGFVFFDDQGQSFFEDGKFLGVATNNEAEYQGLIAGLETLLEFDKLTQEKKVDIRLDSNLVVQQVLGNWKIKEARIRPYVVRIRELLLRLPVPYTIRQIPRAQNSVADAKVNEILDAAQA